MAESIGAELLNKLAKLSKLTIAPEESDQLTSDLTQIVSFVDRIQQFRQVMEVTEAEPSQITGLRPDEVISFDIERDWANLPRNFRVKRVVS